MTNQIDPQNLIKEADDLLADIKKANDDFVNKANTSIKDISANFQKMDEINSDLQKAEKEAVDKFDEAVLKSLAEE